MVCPSLGWPTSIAHLRLPPLPLRGCCRDTSIALHNILYPRSLPLSGQHCPSSSPLRLSSMFHFPRTLMPTPSASSPLPCAVQSSEHYTTTCSSATQRSSMHSSHPSPRLPSNTCLVAAPHPRTAIPKPDSRSTPLPLRFHLSDSRARTCTSISLS